MNVQNSIVSARRTPADVRFTPAKATSDRNSFFSSLKTERTARKTYRTREDAKADVFNYVECFYNAKRRHSTIGYMSPVEFEN